MPSFGLGHGAGSQHAEHGSKHGNSELGDFAPIKIFHVIQGLVDFHLGGLTVVFLGIKCLFAGLFRDVGERGTLQEHLYALAG